ncbi:MAG: TetR family transcriptional regulator [Candidatus Delongbacteria bacterium]|nr:TetR family transcriptional regulator [Candidatus Delongbacteria bacterium]
MKKDISTEEKILDHAGQIFKMKGFSGARMQEIADSAGINKAMLHYYFRSKKMLFDKIFENILDDFQQNIIITLNDERSWENKLTALSEKLYMFVYHNEDIPIFLFNELHMNYNFFSEQLFKFKEIKKSSFFKQFMSEMKKGNIIKTDPLQVLVHIFSGIIFPVVAKPIISSMGDLNDKQFDQFLLERKKIVPEIIIQYLKNTGV